MTNQKSCRIIQYLVNPNTHEIPPTTDAPLPQERVANVPTHNNRDNGQHPFRYPAKGMKTRIAIYALLALSFYLIGCAWVNTSKPNTQLCPLCNR